MKAVIVAGGEGRRIRSVARTTPKPLLEIGGCSLVEHHVNLLRRYGIREAHLTVRQRDLTAFRSKLGAKLGGATLRYHPEGDALGTAGGIAPFVGLLGGNFLVLYGDVMIAMDLGALVQSHRSRKAAATLVVHPSDHPFDSDLVDMNDDGLIRAFRLKPRPPDCYCRNVGNAGVYVVSHTLADMIPRARCDFVRDIFPRALQEGMALYGYRTREYLRDIGTPERLTAIRTDWATRRVERRHRDVAMPAVFLDRDGTLCELVPLLHKAGDLRLVRGAAEAIRHLNRADYLAVVITNQPVVARGLCTLEQLDHIHARMETLLGEHGATLDGIYYCPHHPDAGYRGEVAQHKVACRCRKPGGGLVRRAVSDLNIDLSQSVFVGDSTVDVETGQRLGLRTILVQTGEAGRDGKFSSRPDAICADLPAAVDLILQAKTQNAFTTKTPRHKG